MFQRFFYKIVNYFFVFNRIELWYLARKQAETIYEVNITDKILLFQSFSQDLKTI